LAILRKRIHETKSLYEILPSKNASSGREFARIINLLLFHDARRNGRTITIFDDRSGDYYGLDAFEHHHEKKIIGFQHKFFPSPLTDEHRQQIKKSLEKTIIAVKRNQLTLKKWVLITPQDFIESNTRKSGGDVTWFEELRKENREFFDMEHWGHSQIQAFFIDTPSIGLYYYPELFDEGITQQKTIKEIRARYDECIEKEFGNIEFVGMSVYKSDATRSIPIESIYIPLSIIPNNLDETNSGSLRQNPLELLERDTKHIILGDPGSGKSTLLKFLALYGISTSLQKKFGHDNVSFCKDERLPLRIILRSYAKAAESTPNLSILDYIQQKITSDFSLPGVTKNFFEYYLESGKTILLFDGLDELPSPQFKKDIRDKINYLSTTYPGNTIIVTSRIYGYDKDFQFNEKDYIHHRLAKLKIEEIEQFITEWYHGQIGSIQDQLEYRDSLLKIIRNDSHVAIRELAKNPLLLTIIVLVHRIDAVLPDQRHVLYQKCTETLLNTWHTWKFYNRENLHRVRDDRLNMLRMQAIAYWMHHQISKAESGRQAVVSYKELHDYLTQHIMKEKRLDPEKNYEPEDIATVFIEFIQDRAGLLIEIGDLQFSFIHLTFQEYLTAMNIKTISELNGVTNAWKKEISARCNDPNWREVLRLLIASYGSDDSQEYLIKKIIDTDKIDQRNAQLLGGLLLDGVESAIMMKEEIILRVLLACLETKEKIEFENLLELLKSIQRKHDMDFKLIKQLSIMLRKRPDTNKTNLRFTLFALAIALDEIRKTCGNGSEFEMGIMKNFAGMNLSQKELNKIDYDLARITKILESKNHWEHNFNFLFSVIQFRINVINN
jgi:hypothetical protein